MKRLGAAAAVFLVGASFVVPALMVAPIDAKPRAAKSTAAKSTTAKSTTAKASSKNTAAKAPATRKRVVRKPAKKAPAKEVETAAAPLPDRNPKRNVALAQPSEATTIAAPAAPAPAAPQIPIDAAAPASHPHPVAHHAAGGALKPPMMLGSPPTQGAPNTTIILRTPHASAPLPSLSDSSASGAKVDFAGILKPLLSYQMSAADAANLKEAFGATYRGDDPGAHTAAARIKDPAARKLAVWFEYRSGDLDSKAEDIEAFRLANPDWPGQDELRERAEIALFLADPTPERVRAFFIGASPITGAGKAAMASAFLKEGNQAAARELVASAWREYQLSATVEKKILDRFGSMLSKEDHQARVDKLLFPDSEQTAEAALRVSKLLPPADQKKVAARIAVVKRGANAGKLLEAIPATATQGDLGLLYNKIQWLRRKDRDQEAWKMLLDVPNEPAQLIDPDGWWSERRLNCRIALNSGQPRIAYDIAARHGPISGDAYTEANFLAGWIALRFLGDSKTALAHFVALRAAAAGSKNIALAEYWLGRTALALGDSASAVVHFHAAAKYPQYLYGQLGRQALDPAPARLSVTPTPRPSEADIKNFYDNHAVRALGIALATDMERLAPQFFIALARRLNSAAEVVLLTEMAKISGHSQIALRVAKIAFNRDLAVGDYALPLGVIPNFKSLHDEKVERALVHALSRQESEFNAAAKSPVGASGLMQLMPGTAKAVAKAYKVKYLPKQLTDASYNAQLGEAHLRDLISSYSGSYIMTLAAYNAGGGRVQEWVKAFGDPRKPDVDPIDWIERIPFTETRDYVKKIMETLQLYRSRLEGSEHALQLVQDLNRGRRAPKEPVSAQISVTD
jgi:soluble lytic murein transglycosylase